MRSSEIENACMVVRTPVARAAAAIEATPGTHLKGIDPKSTDSTVKGLEGFYLRLPENSEACAAI
eukprot:COSAG02_NODE_974_length_15518_cov_97.334717_5_plen_65_part_00